MKDHRNLREKKNDLRAFTEQDIRFKPLIGVLLGAAIFAAGLACLYVVMRSVGLEQGGSCVSGGPYQIAPGQECESGTFPLAFAGVLGLMAGFAIFVWSSSRYGGQLVVTSASGLAGTGFFGGLGLSFMAIASELPASSAEGSEFKTVGIIFLVLGLFGLFPAVGAIIYSMQSRRIDYPRPSVRSWLAWLVAVTAAAGFGIVFKEFGVSYWNG
jgi:hypothetical protein